MRYVNVRALSSPIRQILAGGLIYFASIQWGHTANAQAPAVPSPQTETPTTPPTTDPPPNPAPSDYSIDSKSTTQIQYTTKRDEKSGVSTLDAPAQPMQPATIVIDATPSSGVPPAGILVMFKYSYKGVPFKFTTMTATKLDKTSFSVDLTGFATDLITKMKQRLRSDFDPNCAIVLDGPVQIWVIPLLVPAGTDPLPLPPYKTNLGTPTRTTNDLNLTLQPTSGVDS